MAKTILVIVGSYRKNRIIDRMVTEALSSAEAWGATTSKGKNLCVNTLIFAKILARKGISALLLVPVRVSSGKSKACQGSPLLQRKAAFAGEIRVVRLLQTTMKEFSNPLSIE